MPTNEAVCKARLSGLATIRSKWRFSALRQVAIRMHCCLPSLSSGRLASRAGFLRGVPALAWRRMYRFMVWVGVFLGARIVAAGDAKERGLPAYSQNCNKLKILRLLKDVA